nr:uncharacterized protein LOC111422932 [Onthophagus taurus]
MTSICNKESVNCIIQPCHSGNLSFNLKAIVTSSICSAQPSLSSIIQSYDYLKCLQFHPEHHSPSEEVDILLGAELVHQLFTGGRVCGGQDDPVAVYSVFGWIVMGKSKLLPSTSLSTSILTIDDSLHLSMQRFWELESTSEIKMMSIEEAKCETHYKNNYRRDINGRFIVSFPFRTKEPILGNSYDIALKRFKLLEKRLLRDDILHKKYVEFMRDHLHSLT